MKKATIIGVDLAKNVFQLHGAAADGSVVFRKKLTRLQFQRFMADHPACTVVMEACGSAHHWAREMAGMGHAPRLIAPKYVKPFVKRQKNDSADAEAIVEAAQRPTMRFVEIKSLEDQARAVLFRARAQLIRQRTEAANALRAHLYEFGFVAPLGISQVKRLAEIIEAERDRLPSAVRLACGELLTHIAQLTERLGSLDKEIIRRIIRRHINEVKYCYEQELTKKPDLGGRIMVQFTIAASGQVIASVLQNSTMGNARVENCTVQAVRRWEFPKPLGGGIVIVSYPFVLTPAG